jgi:hypothetical protein
MLASSGRQAVEGKQRQASSGRLGTEMGPAAPQQEVHIAETLPVLGEACCCSYGTRAAARRCTVRLSRMLHMPAELAVH